MDGAPHHTAVLGYMSNHLKSGNAVGILPQVIHEFLHVVTDPRRFASPLSMPIAAGLARTLWDAREVVRLLPSQTSLSRTLELLEIHRLGRKRILDTALAAALESARIPRLITMNARDFRIFPFLETHDPRDDTPAS